MSKKKVTILLIIGFLVGLFVADPILSFLGLPSVNNLLVTLFGENNPIVMVGLILVTFLVIFGAYKKT